MSAPVSDSVSSTLIYPWNPAGSGSVDATGLEAWVEDRLRRHREAIERLLAAEGPRTIERTLRAYDDAVAELAAVGSLTGLVNSVYPEKAVRDTAQALLQKISQAGVELSLNRDVYQALNKIDASGADAPTKHYLDRTLLQYRLAGVDKDDATRARIKELQDQATLTSLNFARNVQEGGNTVTVENAAELEGLPADFLESHQPGEDGKIMLTTDFPDYLPVMTFARSIGFAAQDVSGLQHAGVSSEPAAAARPAAHPAGDCGDSGLRALGRSGDGGPDDGVCSKYAGVPRRSGSGEQGRGGEGIRDDPGVCAGRAAGSESRSTQPAAAYWVEQYRRSAFAFDSQSVRPYFPYAQRGAGRAGDGGEAVPGEVPARRECRCVASVGERMGRVRWRRSWRGGSISTCIRARARTSGSRRIR